MQEILLIDDSKSIHPLVKSLLGEEPVTIHSAFDGQYGLVLAESMRPDLILLDVEMPGVDGFETCRRLKLNPATASLPIIFLTAVGGTDEMVRGLNMGANDYVVKPFKLSELLSRVRAGLRTSHMIRLLEEKAMIDALTGLGNSAMLKARLAAEVSLRIRSGNPLSCVAMNVDQFKQMNDNLGHTFSERVLKQIGDALLQNCRIEDVVCRVDGPKFVILAPQTTAEQASLLAKQICVAIAKIPFTHQGKPVAVTCSFGVADAVGVYDRSMQERAQQAASLSSKSGPNHISIAPAPLEATAVAA